MENYSCLSYKQLSVIKNN